jgi:hypothetical protein
MQIRGLKVFAGIVVLMFVAGGVARAETKKFRCSFSGTSVDVPVDIDGDSCFTASNGATVCTDTSGYGNSSAKCNGASVTSQNINEYDFVPGTSSCNILGTMVPGFTSCKLRGSRERSEQGCKFKLVGGAEVDKDPQSGDLTFVTPTAATICLDLSSGPPFNFTGSGTNSITGGTGKNAGITGTGTFTFNGQLLVADAAGHGLSWSEGRSNGTITTP